jgi:hypothetical protein
VREPFGVVDILVAGETAVDRLAHEVKQPVADVRPAPPLGEIGCGRCGEAEGVVQLSVREQAGVGVILAPWNSSLSRRSKATRSGSFVSPVTSAISYL